MSDQPGGYLTKGYGLKLVVGKLQVRPWLPIPKRFVVTGAVGHIFNLEKTVGDYIRQIEPSEVAELTRLEDRRRTLRDELDACEQALHHYKTACFEQGRPVTLEEIKTELGKAAQ